MAYSLLKCVCVWFGDNNANDWNENSSKKSRIIIMLFNNNSEMLTSVNENILHLFITVLCFESIDFAILVAGIAAKLAWFEWVCVISRFQFIYIWFGVRCSAGCFGRLKIENGK